MYCMDLKNKVTLFLALFTTVLLPMQSPISLPYEMWQYIISFLTCKERDSIQRVNSQIKNIIESHAQQNVQNHPIEHIQQAQKQLTKLKYQINSINIQRALEKYFDVSINLKPDESHIKYENYQFIMNGFFINQKFFKRTYTTNIPPYVNNFSLLFKFCEAEFPLRLSIKKCMLSNDIVTYQNIELAEVVIDHAYCDSNGNTTEKPINFIEISVNHQLNEQKQKAFNIMYGFKK